MENFSDLNRTFSTGRVAISRPCLAGDLPINSFKLTGVSTRHFPLVNVKGRTKTGCYQLLFAGEILAYAQVGKKIRFIGTLKSGCLMKLTADRLTCYFTLIKALCVIGDKFFNLAV